MTKPGLRRPLVAFTIEIKPTDSDPRYEVQSEAYGLEMSIDDEWPIDSVMIVPPGLVDVVTANTGLMTTGTTYAGVAFPKDEAELRQAISAKAKWVCLDSDDPQNARQMALVAGTPLKIILMARKPAGIGAALKSARIPADRLVLALHPVPYDSLEVIQDQASKIRQKLHAGYREVVRILIVGNTREIEFVHFALLPDVDGLLIPGGHFEGVISVIRKIALNM